MADEPTPAQKELMAKLGGFAIMQRMKGTPREEIKRQLLEKGLPENLAESLLKGYEEGIAAAAREGFSEGVQAGVRQAVGAGVDDAFARHRAAKAQAAAPAVPGEPKPVLSIVALCLGIASLVLCWVPCLAALPGLGGAGCGIYVLMQPVEKQPKRGLALAGAICGGAGALLSIVWTIIWFAIIAQRG